MTKAPKPTGPAAKPAAAKPKAKPAAKPAPLPQIAVVAAVPAAPRLVPAEAPPASLERKGNRSHDEGPALRKKDFVARVLAISGAKKKDALGVIDATLKVLGEALSKGESLALPAFGKARVSRQIDKSGGEMLVVKLRRGGTPKPGKGKKSADESLAEGDD